MVPLSLWELARDTSNRGVESAVETNALCALTGGQQMHCQHLQWLDVQVVEFFAGRWMRRAALFFNIISLIGLGVVQIVACAR